MNTTFFLAANSGRGFCSRYGEFPGPGMFLHIIKGGPGTGKSGWMKRIRAEAAARGLDSESILCSGDPDSLDALLIPALGQAWMDGTAPHVREPKLFGVDGDYVNLGRFCRLPLSGEDRQEVRACSAAYKSRYDEAYALLGKALAARGPEDCEHPDEADNCVRRLLGDGRGEPGAIRTRFLSAVSCRGLLTLEDTARTLCRETRLLPGGGRALRRAAELAAEAGREVIVCLDPLDGESVERVLLPREGLAFVSRKRESPAEEELCRQACETLAEAKRLHDALEAVYRPYMDFDALNEALERQVNTLFFGR